MKKILGVLITLATMNASAESRLLEGRVFDTAVQAAKAKFAQEHKNNITVTDISPARDGEGWTYVEVSIKYKMSITYDGREVFGVDVAK